MEPFSLYVRALLLGRWCSVECQQGEPVSQKLLLPDFPEDVGARQDAGPFCDTLMREDLG